MDMSQYLDVFLEESREHLGNLNQKLLELEKNTGNLSALNEIFRAAHTLKGMSSTMGFEDLADLTHHMEDVLSDLKEGILTANSSVVDVLFKCLDRIQMMVDNIEQTGSGSLDNQDLIHLLENIKQGEASAIVESDLEFEPDLSESEVVNNDQITDFQFNDYEITVLNEANSKGFNIYYIKVNIDPDCLMKSVRAFMVFRAIEEEGEVIKSIPTAQDLDEGRFENDFELFVVTHLKQEKLMNIINAISEVKVSLIQEVNVKSEIANFTNMNQEKNYYSPINDEGINKNNLNDKNDEGNKKVHKVKQTVRVDIERLDNLMNLVGELVMHKGRLEQIGSVTKIAELNETIEQIDRISSDLQSVVMKVRMVPIEQVFNRFPRMVRDLAKELNKEVDFIIEGKETELDRTVIDEIGDPLVHLLRNAVDHGLESREERIQKGKSPQGTVMLRARHEGNNVFIEVEDDGSGVNAEKVLQKALEKGLITPQEAEKMPLEEAVEILFYPGFSTAKTISDVSGRGVGLDVVKSKIESLNGEIFIETKPGLGTKFKIKLPLTLAIIQALMVSVRDEIYAIPLSSVDETTMITNDDIKMVQNQEVMMLRGNVLPIYRLSTLLDIPGEMKNENEMYVVVVRKAERQIGLVVDTLIGQQEIVIKSLGKVLGGIPGIAGAIVAGDGNVRLILDIATLF
ncbi:MAG: chemotaxis protein CheA [Syntrophomonadaceae bacterium]|nr:chemotaxis protein CheA [Syntrophomonadaceae bacterium]